MNNNSLEQPDPDNIKMFVGQVPHDMDENDLRTMFEEYGRVHQINILRDKITGSHRGKWSNKFRSESRDDARRIGLRASRVGASRAPITRRCSTAKLAEV